MIDAMDSAVRAGSGPSSTDATGSSKLGKDEFLKLLMTQLQNQDPTQPQSSEDFIAQLAQFASLENAQQTNSQLEALLIAQAGANQLASLDLVGKEVTFPSDSYDVNAGVATPREVMLAGPAQTVTVVVKDSLGREVSKEVRQGPFDAGSFSFTPPTHGPRGALDGTYTLEVTAATSTGANVDAKLIERARVAGITYENGYAEILIGDRRLALSEVVSVLEGTGELPPALGGTSAAAPPRETVDDGRVTGALPWLPLG